MSESKWCEMGCGYELPTEYGEGETTCGACLNEMKEQLQQTKGDK